VAADKEFVDWMREQVRAVGWRVIDAVFFGGRAFNYDVGVVPVRQFDQRLGIVFAPAYQDISVEKN
jgi:hypothetical protein